MEYSTQSYEAVVHECRKIIAVCATPSSDALVIAVLFDRLGHTSAHVSLAVLDLDPIGLRHLRVDIEIEAAEFDRCCKEPGFAGLQFSSLSVLEMGYAVLRMGNILHIRSLGTGAAVISSPAALSYAKEIGLARGALAVLPNSDNGMDLFFAPQGHHCPLRCVRIRDRNTVDTVACVRRQRPTPTKQTKPFLGCLADGTDARVLTTYLRSLLWDIVTKATQSAQHNRETKKLPDEI